LFIWGLKNKFDKAASVLIKSARLYFNHPSKIVYEENWDPPW